ncbi:polyketide synthase dehydratase domain-containing protein (plasmid) [Mycobacterium ulcerans]|nr:polyketide synthase dehydratase domain-containing protein [Mycobacterium ulcerans]
MHPLLDTATELAENRGWVFTGRISPRTQPWLNEHAVESAVLFPGTGFVELALHVADRAGYSSVNELIVHTPAARWPRHRGSTDHRHRHR